MMVVRSLFCICLYVDKSFVCCQLIIVYSWLASLVGQLSTAALHTLVLTCVVLCYLVLYCVVLCCTMLP
ncbi:hypothetical protein BZA77DRAFT_319290 [Pyronema omphalodes]|nr:hypothetical protein BZA77DRAFT_319290 [Pyronema omphalodes]